MFFFVDESGHTGTELFDPAQPMLYYGVLSSDLNLDVVAEGELKRLRARLSVPRLHAGELGNGRLVKIASDLAAMQKRWGLRFDLYRVNKPDHAIICFFDQVFDSGMNEAVGWTHYWTPLRYVLLLQVATLFDATLAQAAWAARIEIDQAKSDAGLVTVCSALLARADGLPDQRARQIIRDALAWAVANPAEISYNVNNKDQIKQISPNIIGFQSVMLGIAGRLRLRGRTTASRIVVDRQAQFNMAQKTLADFYAAAAGFKQPMGGAGMPVVNYTNMPKTPIEFLAGTASAGLELVDVYLWISKRYLEDKELANDLLPLLRENRRGKTDEVSLKAIKTRWEEYFDQIPQLQDLSPEQLKRARELTNAQEQRRLTHTMPNAPSR